MGEMRNAYSVLVGKPEGKRPLGRPWHRWGHNKRMDLKVRCGLDTSSSGQGPVVDYFEHANELQVP
jgi:hypothetical protein